MRSRQVLLAARPAGAPRPSDFRLVEVDVPEPGPGELLVRNIYMSVDPFIISDHMKRYPEFLAEVGGWLKAGRIKYQETVVDGIEQAVTAFLGLFSGDNTGKMVVRLGPEPPATGSR